MPGRSREAPGNLQNYNRYSYALDNPLSYTDPSGFFNIGRFFKKLFKGISNFFKGFAKFVFSRQGLAIVVSVALLWATGGLAGLGMPALIASLDVGVVASGAIAGAAAGAITTGTLKGAIFGAVSGAVAGAIAGVDFSKGFTGELAGLAGDVMQGAAQGFAQGSIAAAQGGDFRTGFMSAAFASVAGAQAGGLLPEDVATQLVGRSIVGGTASVIGGGKFANGAYSAAFNYAVQRSAQELQQGGLSPDPGERRTLQSQARSGRALTAGEKALAAQYAPSSGSAVDWDRVRLIPSDIDQNRVMPGYDVELTPSMLAVSDFSNPALATVAQTAVFLHELTHVWQYVQLGGVDYLIAAANRDYKYTINSQSKFDSFSMEQQASIVQDHYNVSNKSYAVWSSTNSPLSTYKSVLGVVGIK